jgi:hypothetical protein
MGDAYARASADKARPPSPTRGEGREDAGIAPRFILLSSLTIPSLITRLRVSHRDQSDRVFLSAIVRA